MRTWLFAILALCAFACAAQANEYEVQLGDRTYIVKEGQATRVETPKGEKILLLVKKRPILDYSDDVLSFSYRSEMKLSTQNELGIKTITAECENSTLFMAQVFPYQIESVEAVDTLIANFKEQYKQYGATFPEDSVVAAERMISKVKRTGKKLRSIMGKLKNETEIFALSRSNQTIALIFQADHEDRAEAEKYFKVIADSIQWRSTP